MRFQSKEFKEYITGPSIADKNNLFKKEHIINIKYTKYEV